MIARVFPRKTAMSPTDALAFFGPPTIENIADCIQAGVTEVHISVTFTWDLEKAEDLYYEWQILGSNLRIYDTPRELREFYAVPNEVEVALKAKPKPITRPPQSWRYVEEDT